MNVSPARPLLTSLIFAAVFCGAAVQMGVFWFSAVPLGIPGEWVWPRLEPVGPLLAMIWPAVLVGALLTGYVCLNALPFNHYSPRTRGVLLIGLWGIGIVWTLSLAASTPGIASLSRIPFVLFYTRSSGYFTQAAEHRHDVSAFLKGYRERIADSSNPENHLHLGTHPPGLTLGLIGLLRLCEESPLLRGALVTSQPQQVRESNDAIRELQAMSPQPVRFGEVEAAVLWLAGLITVVMAAGTCVPLYLLARRFVEPSAAWWSAAFWLLVPAVAIFLPKSDILFPCLTMWAQWLWLAALDRNRFCTGWATGLVMCLALSLSLAFAPVALILFLQGVLLTLAGKPRKAWVSALRQRWRPPTGAVLALLGWLFLCGVLGRMNLLAIWIQNLKNHAAFYAHNVRTYWLWLLENPLELGGALGAPLAVLSLLGLWTLLKMRPPGMWEVLIPVLVWGALWLSGKNMGEAARLWVFLMPYAVWCAAPGLSRWTETRAGWRLLAVCYVVQLCVALATAIRIDGFGFGELGL